MSVLEVLTYGEHSIIEIAEVFLLAIVLFLLARTVKNHTIATPVGALLTIAAAVVVLMIGRELSYGKYHGVPHEVRTVVRNLARLAAIAVSAYCIYRHWPERHALIASARSLIKENFGLLAASFVILVVSQLIDKDIIYAIQPPVLSAAIEESLELVSYVLLIVVAWRLYRRSRVSAPVKSIERSRIEPT